MTTETLVPCRICRRPISRGLEECPHCRGLQRKLVLVGVQRCRACGEPLSGPETEGVPSTTPTVVVITNGVVTSASGGSFVRRVPCQSCGDSDPRTRYTSTGWSRFGTALVWLQGLYWGFVMWTHVAFPSLFDLPGKMWAILSGVAFFALVTTWSQQSKLHRWLAIPLWLLLAFMPLFLVRPMELRITVAVAALVVNAIVVWMMMRVHRKPFWYVGKSRAA